MKTPFAQCREDGQKVTVSVVDQAGREKVRIRDDGAAPHSEVHAFRKAYTALTYRMPSADYGTRAAESKGAIGPQLLPNLTSAGGGGHDAKCAEAGIRKVKF
ncbi:MAG TPA: heme-binding protein [Burkholderiales bacterium]|nr:heme-binding protein [Burkholderiales bacterium]